LTFSAADTPTNSLAPTALWARLLFWFALASEIALFAALNLFDDWRLESMPVKFAATAALSGIGYLVAASFYRRGASLRQQAATFWGVAILLRLLALPLSPSDDFWRYQWEGKIQQAGFNPYVFAPDDPHLEMVRANFPDWLKINHRDYGAIYPPGAEMLFAELSRISESPLLYKIVFMAADLAVAALLLRLIGGQSRYAVAAWYAWNPMVAYSFAGGAHFDSLMLLPMMAGILFFVRMQATANARSKWWFAGAGAIVFGIAISIKLIPLLLLPVCIFALGFRAIVLLLSAGVPALLSLAYGYPRVAIWHSLSRFVYVTRVNDLFWWLIEDTIWPNPHQKNYHYNVILIIAVVLVSLLFFWNWKRGVFWVLGVALVLSPVLHPWYCTWILPVATWRRVHAWHVLSVTLFAYFVFWNERLFALPWHAEPWMRVIIMLPPIVLALFATARKREPVVSEDPV